MEDAPMDLDVADAIGRDAAVGELVRVKMNAGAKLRPAAEVLAEARKGYQVSPSEERIMVTAYEARLVRPRDEVVPAWWSTIIRPDRWEQGWTFGETPGEAAALALVYANRDRPRAGFPILLGAVEVCVMHDPRGAEIRRDSARVTIHA
jgi:hypothetical protein